MNIGFEIVAAKPKGVPAADQPTQQPIRGDVKISRNPSTDQKKVRRAQQRKTATKTICRNCHSPMIARDGDDFPLCPECKAESAGANKTAEMADAPGSKRECRACGHNGPPVLSDTGPACAMCGSYSLNRASSPRAATKTATQVDVRADRLNPGDYIRTPTGQVVKVQRVRNHQTSGDHVYVDTEAGTTLSRRGDSYTIVPYNASQQESPGFGTPGGNFNDTPGVRRAPHGGQDAMTNQAPKGAVCPVCGSVLHRQGDHYVCPRDGFTESVNNVGGHQFFDQPTTIGNPRRAVRSDPGLPSKDAVQSTTNNPVSDNTTNSGSVKNAIGSGHMSAIARRAHEVLISTELISTVLTSTEENS